MMICSKEFSILEDRNSLGPLFIYRPELFIRGEERFKNRYYGLKFPLTSNACIKLLDSKIAITKKIMSLGEEYRNFSK